ncbi:hypothetical protein GCM10023189_35600 [Nibrella saemangeumensis]|uniref:PAP2 superfamily protein n=1 Tax=Nibrella saemangeumensis TaxID=1084526 RepID=A0ABP8N331_9BACT
MKKSLLTLTAVLSMAAHLQAQVEPTAGTWKTWFIASGKDYRLPKPASHKDEVAQVLAAQQNLDAAGRQQIQFWNAGAPGYRWNNMIGRLWMTDTSSNGVLSNLLLHVATYDATIAAWDTKYAYNRPRPYAADSRIKVQGIKPDSPSYPCEVSVAAGVASTIIAHFYPHLADSVRRMAQQAMASRIAAGMAFPSDTRAGFELGKRIAEAELAQTKDYVYAKPWDGKRPDSPGIWNGKKPMFPTGGLNKTVVLTNASQFRPGPPSDFAKDMAELKAFKQTFRSKANAFYYASQFSSDDLLNKKMFEQNLHLNAPRAARIYAAVAIASYDSFVSCWDAKYAYWGIRPDQYDPTYQSLVPTPPFPGYPSGHAVMTGMIGELYAHFFPADRVQFQKIAKDGAESRFQAGIHFRTDNDTGLDLGRKVANAVIQRIMTDGADEDLTLAKRK